MITICLQAAIKDLKMTWNYRIVKSYDKTMEEEYYFLTEVFYNKDGSLMAYSDHEEIVGSSPSEVIAVLEMMLADAKKDRPILTEEDFKE